MSSTSLASSFLLLVFVSKVIVVVGAGRIAKGFARSSIVLLKVCVCESRVF